MLILSEEWKMGQTSLVLSEYIELGAFSKKGRQSYTNQPDWPFKDTFVYIHSVESAREC